MNFVFISPTFPRVYYQFPKAIKARGGMTLGIAEDSYESLSPELKDALCDYYQVGSLEDYDQVYKAVAYFASKYGRIDWLESNNEYWLEQDSLLRTDFNICSGAKFDEVYSFKLKSNMKAYYEAANVPVARYHMVSTFSEGKKFIDLVGYPVVVKPDNGVGANATYKITSEKELVDFYRTELHTQYIMEEYIDGYIVSYDGIAGQNSEIIFETSHVFPEPIMDIVNNKEECFYYSVREIPEDLKEMGRRVIASFKPKGRFFHCEYFRLNKEKQGLGKKGDLVGLEVNMRPPGGYTPDMMNFANDIDVYSIYANMVFDNKGEYETTRPYFCAYVGKRDHLAYKNSDEDIYKKYKDAICMHERMPSILGSAMGEDMYIARFKTEKEVKDFATFVYKKEEPIVEETKKSKPTKTKAREKK